MRAVVAEGTELRLTDIDEPAPGKGQILVRTLANGICGTDLHVLDPSYQGLQAPPGQLRVLGHEFCAEVIDYGPGTAERPFRPGSRVCANPFTKEGGLALVNPGGLAEFMVLDVDLAFPVPETVSAVHAALTEPLAVGIHAVGVGERLTAGVGPYVVNGCGPVGLSVLSALRALGRGPIIAVDLSAPRLAAAARLGADAVVDAGRDSVADHFAEFGFRPQPGTPYLPRGTRDASGVTVYECTGAAGMLAKLIDIVPSHSCIVSVAAGPGSHTILGGKTLMKELTLGWALAYRQDELELSLKRISDGASDPSAFITATVPLDSAAWAFGALRNVEHVKIIVEPTR